MNKKNKKILICSILLSVFLIGFGVTYSFFSYTRSGKVTEIVNGQVYLRMDDESLGINLENAFPMSVSEARSLIDNTYSFSVTGRNTYEKPLYYEIDLVNGDVPNGKTESNRILASYLRFDLIEDGNLVINNMSFDHFNNKRIYVETIDSGTVNNITKNYTLRMWIDENLSVSDVFYADYTTEEFNNLFASVKIKVHGDYEVKRIANLKKTGTDYNFWFDELNDVKSDIISVDFLRITDTIGEGTISESDYSSRYNNSVIKEDVTNYGQPVTAWLELENDKYKMYVASENEIVFPNNCFHMFYQFSSVESFNFYHNVDTSIMQNANSLFSGCDSLTYLDLSSWNTKNLNDFLYMVECSNLKELNMEGWNFSNVSSMTYYFSYTPKLETLNLSNTIFSSRLFSCIFWFCKNLKNLDVTNADVSKVTYMWGWFEYCESLEELDLSTWDTSNVTDMYSMFLNCPKLKRLNLSGWDMSNVTSHNNFYFPGSLEYLDLSNTVLMPNCYYLFDLSNYRSSYDYYVDADELIIDFTNVDTSNVTNMSSMFYNAYTIKHLDLSGWDTSNVTTVDSMFHSCNNLISLNVSGFDISNVISSYWNLPSKLEMIDASNMVLPENSSYLFESYGGVLSNIILTNVDTSKTNNMSGMFSNNTLLTTLDLSSFDTRNVISISSMFSGSTSLKTIYVGNKWNIDNNLSDYSVFDNCTSLVGGNGTTFDSNHIDFSYAHIDGLNGPGYFTNINPGPYEINISSNNNHGTFSGSGTYAKGSVVNLTATPNSGYGVVGWYNSDILVSNDNNYTFNSFFDIDLEVRFSELNTLILQNNNPNMGTISGGGSYAKGKKVTISANSNDGYRFMGWYEGENLVSREIDYTFEFNNNLTLTAKFEASDSDYWWVIDTPVGANYGFSKNANGFYESQNKNIDDSAAVAALTIDVPSDGTKLIFNIIQYSQYYYDYGLIGQKNIPLSNDNTKDIYYSFSLSYLSSDKVSKYAMFLDKGRYTIYIKYMKDGSISSNNDSLQFKISFNDDEPIDAFN